MKHVLPTTILILTVTLLALSAPASAQLDTDFDSILDINESCIGTSATNPDSDGDFIRDNVEAGGTICPFSPTNTDGEGPVAALDTDSDNDTISDRDESRCTIICTNPADSGGVPSQPDYRDTDSDGDGISDAIEAGDE